MASLFGAFPFLVKLYADGGYQGLEFQSAIKRICRASTSRSSSARVKPQASSRCPNAGSSNAHSPGSAAADDSPAKDWECLNHKALAFLRLASIRLMLRKLPVKVLAALPRRLDPIAREASLSTSRRLARARRRRASRSRSASNGQGPDDRRAGRIEVTPSRSP